MSLSEKNCPRYDAIHRVQKGQSSFFELECPNIDLHREIVETKSFAHLNASKLPIQRIGIGEFHPL